MKTITVADYTLRKLNESGVNSLLFREKAAIAVGLDKLGADIIELPAVRSPKEDAVIGKTISASVSGCRVCIPAGSTPKEIEDAWNCVKFAQVPRLQIALPTSTVQMEYRFHIKESACLEMIRSLCASAKGYRCEVEFAALDATRTALPFLIDACTAAVESGADCVTLCDDAGECLPEEIRDIVSAVRKAVRVQLLVQVSDKIGLGVANAVTALRAGADGVKTCISGSAFSDTLPTARFDAAVRAKGELLGFRTGLKETELQSDIDGMLKKLGHAADKKASSASEESAELLLDASSSVTQIADAVKLLGYALSDEDLGHVCDALRLVFEKKDSVGRKELDAVIASSAMQVPSTYHLKNYVNSSSNLTAAMSQVVLTRGDEELDGVASGDGPIDASFKALEQCLGCHYELDDFQIQAVTEGREALGSALVRLRSGGKLYSGNGISADIVSAAIRAYINALNKIVYDETNV